MSSILRLERTFEAPREAVHDRRRVLMPGIVAVTWLARLLPVAWFDAVARMLGITTSMEDFVGHGHEPAPIRPKSVPKAA